MDINKMMSNPEWTRVLQIRQALLQNGFWNTETINTIITSIDACIGVIKFDYDHLRNCITIQIRKTLLKKNGMTHDVLSYYPLVSSIMTNIMVMYKKSILACLANYFGISNINNCKELFDLYNWMLSDSACISNLVNIQCVGDNVVQIIL